MSAEVPYDLREVLAKLQRLQPVTLEEMLTSPDYFNLPASKLQVAIARAIDGRPLGDLAKEKEILEAFGGAVEPRGHKPIEVDILSAIRAGKSLIAACTAVHWTQTCDLSRLRPGDIARVSIVSLTKKNAAAVFTHIVKSVGASPKLSALVVGNPSSDTIVLRHPSGRTVEICVAAGTRAGGSLVSTWSAGVIFDEYTRMVGDEEGVINYDEMHAAVIGRLLSGAQIVSIGSPYGSTGPAYRRHGENFGKKAGRVLVIKAPGWIMNPSTWTPEHCAAFKANDPDAYRTDCAAEFSSPEEAMYPVVDIEKSRRLAPFDLTYERGAEYVAAMDPATRSNSWTLVIATRKGRKLAIACARQWTPTQDSPLDPEVVIGEVAETCREYKVRNVTSDQVMFDALRGYARMNGLSLTEKKMTARQILAAHTNLKMRIAAGDVELHPDQTLRDDMLRVKKVVTSSGAQVKLPKTSDGRHCDYAPAVVLALNKWIADYVKPSAPDTETQRLNKQEDTFWKDAERRSRIRRAA